MKIKNPQTKEGSGSFRVVNNLLRGLQSLDSDMLKDQGIGLEEAVLLCCVSERCKCQGDIASETGLTATQASRLLSKLESKGLLKREISLVDKRKMIFSLSSEGEKKLNAVTPLVNDYVKK